MNKKAKRITVALVAVLCFLLVFALGFGLTGAWYEAKRTATGTVTLDQGIKIAYTGFVENGNKTEWGKDTTLTLFATTSGVPQKEVVLPVAQIGKVDDAKVIPYYVRVKVTYGYQLYAAGTRNLDGDQTYTADQLNIKEGATFTAATDAKFVQTQLAFDTTNWTTANGWTYYTVDGALAALPVGPVALFATTAVEIEDATENRPVMKLADWTSEFGGPIVELKTATGTAREVGAIIVTLTVEAIQTEAAATEGWRLN